jgi:hypothetical protein
VKNARGRKSRATVPLDLLPRLEIETLSLLQFSETLSLNPPGSLADPANEINIIITICTLNNRFLS